MIVRVPSVEEIKQAISASKLLTWNGDRDWTLAVKRSLGALGMSCGWGVCTASLGPPFEREWLFDQTWYVSPSGQLREIGLLMECEWSPKLAEIQHDFEKLLVGRASIKVMVFSAEDAECEAIFDHLYSGFRLCRHSDPAERYLLACWLGSSRRYEIREWPSEILARKSEVDAM